MVCHSKHIFVLPCATLLQTASLPSRSGCIMSDQLKSSTKQHRMGTSKYWNGCMRINFFTEQVRRLRWTHLPKTDTSR
ncbi:hypothetical protein PF005_g21319, partial [Phytophthora fragariae]